MRKGTINRLLVGIAAPRDARSVLSADKALFFKELRELQRNKNLKPGEVVKLVDWSRIEGTEERGVGAPVAAVRNANSLSSDTWNRLSPEEKLLIALYPREAVFVKAAQEKTDKYLRQSYKTHRDGSESNAFRHALWNAFMARDIGSGLAALFATAHEAWPDEMLMMTSWEGFTGLEHKAMDLHNNAKGRECVNWYDWFVSDETLVTRVKEKIRNGEMKILVK